MRTVKSVIRILMYSSSQLIATRGIQMGKDSVFFKGIATGSLTQFGLGIYFYFFFLYEEDQ